MSKTITVTIPDFEETINSVACVINPDKWDDDQAKAMVQGLVAQGLRIIIQRSTASADDPKKAIRDKVAALQRGNYTFGGGGGGSPKQTPEIKGWIEFLKAINHKENKKEVNGKTLHRAQETLCRQWMLRVKNVPTEQVNAKLVDYLDEFITWMEAENAGLVGYIELEKKKAAASNITLGF